MLRIRHGFRLGKDVVAYAAINRVWWIIPMVVLLALILVAVTAAHTVVPYTVYTLF